MEKQRQIKDISDDRSKRKQAEKISIKEGSAYSVMDGFGLRYITPYALALGASNFYIGVISSLPSLLGNIVQLSSLKLMKTNSRKKIVGTAVFSQALLWIPLILIGALYFLFDLSSTIAVLGLIISYTLLSIAGSMGSPAWNSWMKDVVKENCGYYFGKRNRIVNIVLILAMALAGLILSYFTNKALTGFMIIFTIAFIGRLFSGYFITRQYEPEFKFEESYYFDALEFVKKMNKNNFGKFVIFVTAISFATAIASPFFTVYMLKDLNFSYLKYTIYLLVTPLFTIIFMPFWGKFGDRFGNVKLLKLTGLFIPFIPLVWIITLPLLKLHLNYLILPFILITEMFSGILWSGFNLAAANFIYDAVSRQRMAICAAYFNLLNAIGTFIGAIIGGLIATFRPELFTVNIILWVFLLSSFLRMIAYILLSPRIKEVKPVEKVNVKEHLKNELRCQIDNSEKRIKGYFRLGGEDIRPIEDTK